MGIKYNNYLNSDWWKYLRHKRLKRNDRCEACGSFVRLQIHHYNYEFKYAGKASKALKHTKVLCSECHTAFHKLYGVKKDMTKEMKEFIRDVKKELRFFQKMRKELKDKEEWILNI